MNCKTPTGADWLQTYGDGYFFMNGVLDTNNGFQYIRYGCGGETWAVGQRKAVRFGGGSGHIGEFVHTACNDYVTAGTSLTSRWNTNNTRVFWIRSNY